MSYGGRGRASAGVGRGDCDAVPRLADELDAEVAAVLPADAAGNEPTLGAEVDLDVLRQRRILCGARIVAIDLETGAESETSRTVHMRGADSSLARTSAATLNTMRRGSLRRSKAAAVVLSESTYLVGIANSSGRLTRSE